MKPLQCSVIKYFYNIKMYLFNIGKWPRTASGHPSTSGTTGSIAIIKNSKLYIGHVGDSGVALGYDQTKNSEGQVAGVMLTTVIVRFINI